MKIRSILITTFLAAMFGMGCLMMTTSAASVIYYVDRDSYTSSWSSGTNYGGQNDLNIGESLGDYYAFVHVTIINKPESPLNAFLRFKIWGISSTYTLSIYTASSAWNEYSITYDNQPALQTLVGTVLLTDDGWFFIDVTSFMGNVSEITFCFAAPGASDVSYIYSRESGIYDNRPYLEWSYESNVPSPIETILIIAAIAACVAIPTILVSMKKKKRLMNSAGSVSSIEPVVVQTSEIGTGTKFCAHCGNQLPANSAFCNACGETVQDGKSSQDGIKDLKF